MPPTHKPCPYCETPSGHPGSSCHFADTGIDALIEKGVARAGSQNRLAAAIGVSRFGLSRALGRGALGDQMRFDLVQYVMGKPVHAPPKVPGRPARRGTGSVAVHLHAAAAAAFDRAVDESPRGAIGVVSEAMERFATKYGGKSRADLPVFALPDSRRPLRQVDVDPDARTAFDLAVGGPGWRRFYLPVAIEEWLRDRHAKGKRA